MNHLKIGTKPREMLKDISSETNSDKGKTQNKIQSCKGQKRQLSGHTASSTENGPRGGPPFLQSLGNVFNSREAVHTSSPKRHPPKGF